MRAFDSSTARLLPDTEGALNAFWSPDSQSLGFFVDGKLKTITLEGELSRVVCDITDPPVVNTGTWNAQNTILFSSWVQGPLMQVSAFGGQAMPITEPGDTRGFPHFLPDGRHYLYPGQGRSRRICWNTGLEGTASSPWYRLASEVFAHRPPPVPPG